MENWQLVLLSLYAVIAVIYGIIGLWMSSRSKAHKKFLPLNIIGAFVWGDAAILGWFWLAVVIASLISDSWFLFELIFLCFWLIRALGEVLYWFNQQFSQKELEPPEQIWFYPLFRNNSVWFIFQLWWQCITAVVIVLLILLLK